MNNLIHPSNSTCFKCKYNIVNLANSITKQLELLGIKLSQKVNDAGNFNQKIGKNRIPKIK